MSELQTALSILLVMLILDLERRVARLEALVQKVFNDLREKEDRGWQP